MDSIYNYMKKMGRVLLGKKGYNVEEIKIFFSAPKPSSPSSEILTLEKDPSKGANFSWVAYQILFSEKGDEDGPLYFIYSVNLDSAGKENPPAFVFKSDSDWSGKEKNNPTKKISPGDVKTEFPDILKGPNLSPQKLGQTVYVNTDDSEKGKNYSYREFQKNFKNDFYVVLNPRKKELKNPFGDIIGVKNKKDERE